MKIVVKENLYETSVQFKKLLEKVEKIEGCHNLIHNTSKTIFKKKKINITNYGDLSGISIMPSIIMYHDKILSQIINEDIDSSLNKNQFGGMQGLDINSV